MTELSLKSSDLLYLSCTISEVVNEAILAIGEKISIRRFVRYEMGEGLEKRVDNLAEEVAKMSK